MSAKPILLIRIIIEDFQFENDSIAGFEKLKEDLKDYHIVILTEEITKESAEIGTVTFECFNDCSGLKDKDIKKLIDEHSKNNKV